MEHYRRPSSSVLPTYLAAYDNDGGSQPRRFSYCTTVLTRDPRFLEPARSLCMIDDENKLDYKAYVPIDLQWFPTEELVCFGAPGAAIDSLKGVHSMCMRYTPVPLPEADAAVFTAAAVEEEASGLPACEDSLMRFRMPHHSEWPRLLHVHGWRNIRAQTDHGVMRLYFHTGVLVVHGPTMAAYRLDLRPLTDEEQRDLAREYTLGREDGTVPMPLACYEVSKPKRTRVDADARFPTPRPPPPSSSVAPEGPLPQPGPAAAAASRVDVIDLTREVVDLTGEGLDLDELCE